MWQQLFLGCFGLQSINLKMPARRGVVTSVCQLISRIKPRMWNIETSRYNNNESIKICLSISFLSNECY